MSRDVIHKIQQLPNTVHNVPFRPEDAYSGYLVMEVRKILRYEVEREISKKLALWYYKCGLFDKWFYHMAGNVKRHVALHERIRRNDTKLCEI